MCRLLGITAFEFSQHRGIIRNFCELARSGTVMEGASPGHGDGWGMACYLDGKLVVHKSGGNLLHEVDKLVAILRGVGRSPALILHLRKSAWKDTNSARHAHPFQYHNVAFAHNGTVYDYQRLIPGISLPGFGDDALDTEVFFAHFMSAQSVKLERAFLGTVSSIKKNCCYSALNCLFSDGTKLYAYRDYCKEPEYYSLYTGRLKNSCIISSQPIDENLTWKLLDNGQFIEIDL